MQALIHLHNSRVSCCVFSDDDFVTVIYGLQVCSEGDDGLSGETTECQGTLGIL